MIIMKKLFLILFVISAFNLNAQYITKHAKNLKKDINEEGIFYYLPQNIIRIDFEVEQTKNIKGKYCNYAKEVLSTDDYIKDNKTHYSIKKINISTLTETNQLLIQTLDEVMQIQAEGKEKRKQAEIELNRIENDLKNRLLQMRG